MAKRIVEIFESDLSGQESEDVETVSFGWKGQDLEIDLTERERDEFAEVLKRYLEKARVAEPEITVTRNRRSNAASNSRNSLPVGHEPGDVRAWAKAEGIELSSKGRIPAKVEAQYKVEHKLSLTDKDREALAED